MSQFQPSPVTQLGIRPNRRRRRPGLLGLDIPPGVPGGPSEPGADLLQLLTLLNLAGAPPVAPIPASVPTNFPSFVSGGPGPSRSFGGGAGGVPPGPPGAPPGAPPAAPGAPAPPVAAGFTPPAVGGPATNFSLARLAPTRPEVSPLRRTVQSARHGGFFPPGSTIKTEKDEIVHVTPEGAVAVPKSKQRRRRGVPTILNPDGTRSSERTISVGIDGRETLIPTIVDGVQLSEEDAISRAMGRMKKGTQFPSFDTVEEANAFAKQRSESGGAVAHGTLGTQNRQRRRRGIPVNITPPTPEELQSLQEEPFERGSPPIPPPRRPRNIPGTVPPFQPAPLPEAPEAIPATVQPPTRAARGAPRAPGELVNQRVAESEANADLIARETVAAEGRFPGFLSPESKQKIQDVIAGRLSPFQIPARLRDLISPDAISQARSRNLERNRIQRLEGLAGGSGGALEVREGRLQPRQSVIQSAQEQLEKRRLAPRAPTEGKEARREAARLRREQRESEQGLRRAAALGLQEGTSKTAAEAATIRARRRRIANQLFGGNVGKAAVFEEQVRAQRQQTASAQLAAELEAGAGEREAAIKATATVEAARQAAAGKVAAAQASAGAPIDVTGIGAGQAGSGIHPSAAESIRDLAKGDTPLTPERATEINQAFLRTDQLAGEIAQNMEQIGVVSGGTDPLVLQQTMESVKELIQEFKKIPIGAARTKRIRTIRQAFERAFALTLGGLLKREAGLLLKRGDLTARAMANQIDISRKIIIASLRKLETEASPKEK